MTVETRRLPQEGEQKRLLSEPAAQFAPASYNAEEGTVDVVWSTGAAVRRMDWWTGSFYTETLDLRGAKLDRLNAGAPLLLDHWASVRNTIGSVVPGSAKLDGKRGVATLRFDRSSQDGKDAEAKVAAGHVRFVSIGYSINAVTTERGRGTREEPDKTVVTDFEPFEISLVAVPADAGAGLRSLDAAPTTPNPTTTQEARMAEQNQPGSTEPNPATPPAPVATRTEPTAPAGATADQILPIAKRAGLDLAWVEGQVGQPLDAVRDAAIDAVAARGRPIEGTRTPSGDDPKTMLDAMATAIAVRAMPNAARDQKDQRFREFMTMRPSDMVMELAAARGERVSMRDRQDLILRAFHTTSDFPMLLENAGNKMLMAGYAVAAPTFRRIMTQRSFNDFKPHKFITPGDFPALEELLEGGEIKRGTISEKRESLTAKTYAKGIAVTRQMLVNDDLGAFTDFGAMIGRRVSDYENATGYAVVNTASGAGPTLTEGNAAVFTTGRGNAAAAGGAINVANLALARAAIMKQKTLDGLPISVGERMILLVGPDKELEARQVTATIVANQVANVNVFSGFIEVVVDAQIPGNRWYLFADPAVSPIFAYGYVAGQTEPQIRVFNPVQGRDGLIVEVVHDFGVGALDWRGAYFNPGA